MNDDDLPDFSIPPGMKLPGPGDPIGDWGTPATDVPALLKEIQRDVKRREWGDRLRDSESPN